jgi:hypothetical protein
MIEKIFILFLKFLLFWPGYSMAVLSVINFITTTDWKLKIACILLFFVSIGYIFLVFEVTKYDLDED